MLKLYGNWYNPLVRKAALALDLKALPFELVTRFDAQDRAALKRHNPFGDVPCLVDDDMVVTGSSEILRHLDRHYGEAGGLYPEDAGARSKAESLEHNADTTVDGILYACSLRYGPEEGDGGLPDGLLDCAQADLNAALEPLEQALPSKSGWAFGAIGAVEIAYFPHLAALSRLGLTVDRGRFAKISAWLDRLRGEAAFSADLVRGSTSIEAAEADAQAVFAFGWYGNRIGWVLKSGFAEWLWNEIAQGRVKNGDWACV